MKRAMERAEATDGFERLLRLLYGSFERFELAGSLRRGRKLVNDIEAVCTPRFDVKSVDLFGGDAERADLLELRLAELLKAGEISKQPPYERPRDKESHDLMIEVESAWGPRFKKLVIDDMPVDLFIVREPAQWGRIMVTRTGPADFSKALVTERPHGLRPRGIDASTIQGALCTLGGDLIPTPEERDYFDVLEVPYIEPEDRDRWAQILKRKAA